MKDIPSSVTSSTDVDLLATAISETLQFAPNTAGRPARLTDRAAPWWTEECAKAAIEHRKVRRAFPLGFNREAQQARWVLRRVVRRAKRQFWQR